MKKEDLQTNLLFITKSRIESIESNKIAAVTALWEDDTAYISIYFTASPSKIELEEASDICTEIIAEMPADSFLNENFIVLNENDILPSEHIAFKRI